MRFLSTLLFCTVFYCKSFAVQHVQDPRSVALGECKSISFYADNPSFLGDNPHLIYLSYQNHFLTSELNRWKIGTSFSSKWFYIGTGFQWFGFNLYNELKGSLSLGKKLSDHLSIGLNGTFHSLYHPSLIKRKNYLTINIGANYKCNRKSTFFLLYQNPFITGEGIDVDYIERENKWLNGGFFINLTNTTKWIVEADWINFHHWIIRSGFEYNLHNFYIRCGAYGLPVIPSFGMGFKFKSFQLDIAGNWNNNLGYNFNCGIGYTL